MKPMYAKTQDTRLAGLERRVRFLERREQMPNPHTDDELGGGAATPSFAAWGGVHSYASTPAFVTTTIFDETSGGIAFDHDGSYVQILGAGFYQIVVYALIKFVDPPATNQIAILYPKYFNGSGGTVPAGSIELKTANLPTNWLLFPADVNHFQTAQRIHPISLTDATEFPVTIKPEVTFDDDTNFSVDHVAVWGFRISGELSASLSD